MQGHQAVVQSVHAEDKAHYLCEQMKEKDSISYMDRESMSVKSSFPTDSVQKGMHHIQAGREARVNRQMFLFGNICHGSPDREAALHPYP